MWKNIVESGRPQMTIWRVCSACWIPKVKNIHSEYVKVIVFPLQQWLHERASMLHYTYITCLIIQSFRSCPIFYSRNVRVTGLTGKRASKCLIEYSLSSFIAEDNRPRENVFVTFVLPSSSSLCFYIYVDKLFNHQSV